jgi:hypothetical protein
VVPSTIFHESIDFSDPFFFRRSFDLLVARSAPIYQAADVPTYPEESCSGLVALHAGLVCLGAAGSKIFK